ncbi:hypothetical protein AKO1_014990 [Acrasis kona]|uniref:protein-tyrosine-phosphatase n=1 Tax=Acrasis kona TaxID=1008807 RepID=A0AAW2Z1V4_9EUKA
MSQDVKVPIDGRIATFIAVHTVEGGPVLIEVTEDTTVENLYDELHSKATLPDSAEVFYLTTHIDPKDDSKPLLSHYKLPLVQIIVPTSGNWQSQTWSTTEVTKHSLNLYVKSDLKTHLLNQVLEFSKQNEITKLKFPTSLTNEERKFIHFIADQLNISHQSCGTEERYVQIQKKNNKKQSKKGMVNLLDMTKKSHRKIPKGMSVVLDDFLYLGSGLDAGDAEEIEKHNIRRILNVSKEWKNSTILSPEVTFKHVLLEDIPEQIIHDQFEDAIEFIKEAVKNKQKILVHCTVGKSRSASFVLAYLMKEHSLNLKQAHELLVSKRNIIKPNDGFIKQLMLYESKLFENQHTDITTGLSTSLLWEFDQPSKYVELQKEKKKKQTVDVSPIVENLLTLDVLSTIVEDHLGGEYINVNVPKLLALVREFVCNKSELEGQELRVALKLAQDKARLWYLEKINSVH